MWQKHLRAYTRRWNSTWTWWFLTQFILLLSPFLFWQTFYESNIINWPVHSLNVGKITANCYLKLLPKQFENLCSAWSLLKFCRRTINRRWQRWRAYTVWGLNHPKYNNLTEFRKKSKHQSFKKPETINFGGFAVRVDYYAYATRDRFRNVDVWTVNETKTVCANINKRVTLNDNSAKTIYCFLRNVMQSFAG